jgi:glycosyltransferase 2 family protein
MFKNKPLIKFLIKLSVALILLVWLMLKSNIKVIFSNFLLISLPILFISILLSYISIVANSLKWKILLPGHKLNNLFKINLVGQFFNTLLPGQVAGEAAKAYLLGKGNDEFNKIIASVFIDKITGIIGLLIVGVTGLFLTKQDIPPEFSVSIIIFFLFVIIIMFSIRVKFFYNLVINILSKIGIKFNKLARYCNRIVEIINAWKYYLTNSKILFQSMIYGIVYQLFGVITIYLLAQNLHISISLVDWFWILAMLSIALLPPISIGGIGVREGTLIGILGFLGTTRELAITLSFAIYGLQLILAITGGIIYSGLMSQKAK